MKSLILLTPVVAVLLAGTAMAETELSFYSGYQTLPHSNVTGTYPGTGASYAATLGWKGKSFAAPPYYGLRGTWWKTDNLGFGVEFTHAKAYAIESEATALGFDRLEFTDGHNLITANVMYRWPNQWKSFTPYVGAGLGVAIPHVDITSSNGYRTFGYQYTGPVARLIAGAKYDLNEHYALFTEYQFSYSDNSADLTGGGSINTVLVTNALNIGISYKF